METKNPPPIMTEKMPTTKPPTSSSAVSGVSSQGASALIQERSVTVLHPHAPGGDSSTRNQNFRTHALPSEGLLTERVLDEPKTFSWSISGYTVLSKGPAKLSNLQVLS